MLVPSSALVEKEGCAQKAAQTGFSLYWLFRLALPGSYLLWTIECLNLPGIFSLGAFPTELPFLANPYDTLQYVDNFHMKTLVEEFSSQIATKVKSKLNSGDTADGTLIVGDCIQWGIDYCVVFINPYSSQ